MKHAMHFVNKYPSHNSNDGVNDSDFNSDNGNDNDNGNVNDNGNDNYNGNYNDNSNDNDSSNDNDNSNDNDDGDNINFCLNSLQFPGHPIESAKKLDDSSSTDTNTNDSYK